MMTFSDFLATLNPKANILVYLLSGHTYAGDPKQTLYTDSCGNHWTENWLDAIRIVGDCEVLSVKCEKICDDVQYTIVINHRKDTYTDKLAIESNESGWRRLFAS